jgi:hypothetical protein
MQHATGTGPAAVVCVLVAAIGCKTNDSTPPDEVGVSDVTPIPAGECLGGAIRCETPESLPFEPGEVRSCAELDGGELRPRWTAEVSEVDCFAGRCSVALNGVAVGPDGSVWASARLYAPGITAPELGDGSGPIADALLAFDSNGVHTATITELRTRLRHTTLMPAPRLAFDAHGRLTRLATARGADGLELTSYDSAGTRIRASRLIQGASSASGLAAGTRTVVVAHGTEVLEPGSDPPRLVGQSGLALFDSSLNALWNQSALALGQIQTTALTVPDAAGGLTLLMEGPQPLGRETPFRLVHVDAQGSLEWVRDLEGFGPEAVSVADGGAVLLLDEQGLEKVLHRVGPDGRGIWRHELDQGFALMQQSVLGVDRIGRVVLGTYQPTSIQVISDDGRSCTGYRLPVESCVTTGSETQCNELEMKLDPSGTLVFATTSRVGVVGLENLP